VARINKNIVIIGLIVIVLAVLFHSAGGEVVYGRSMQPAIPALTLCMTTPSFGVGDVVVIRHARVIKRVAHIKIVEGRPMVYLIGDNPDVQQEDSRWHGYYHAEDARKVAWCLGGDVSSNVELVRHANAKLEVSVEPKREYELPPGDKLILELGPGEVYETFGGICFDVIQVEATEVDRGMKLHNTTGMPVVVRVYDADATPVVVSG